MSQKRNNRHFARAAGIGYTEGVVINRVNHYRAAWISDVHLGTRCSSAPALLYFLKENDFDTLSAGHQPGVSAFHSI